MVYLIKLDQKWSDSFFLIQIVSSYSQTRGALCL
jgi:hypothetical protein